MQCNINAKGRSMRLVVGLVLALLGLIALSFGWIGLEPDGLAMWLLGLGIGLFLTGAFCIFEGWAGWCAVRATGFKTRI